MSKTIPQTMAYFFALTFLTGVIYPAIIWIIGTLAFPNQANGSIVTRNGKPVASLLVGQNFSQPKYFYGRPSMTPNQPYNAMASGASNYSQFNPEQKSLAASRREALCQIDNCNTTPPPQDLWQASASGLDPDISIPAALFQVERIAKVRHIRADQLQALINDTAEHPFLDYFGTHRVNVVKLNLELDKRFR